MTAFRGLAPACALMFVAGCAQTGSLGLDGTQAAAFPPDYQGRATYQGTYRGTQTRNMRPPSAGIQTSGSNLRIRLDNLGSTGTTQNLGGEAKFTLIIDGPKVQLAYNAPQGGLGSGSVSGVREGGRCTFQDRAGQWQMACGTDRLGGTYSASQPTTAVRLSFDAAPVLIVSKADEERQAAQAKAALQAKLAAMSPLQRKVETVLEQDSRSWIMNRYDIASVSDVRVVGQARGEQTVSGQYTVNGGQPAAVKVVFAQNTAKCVEMSDFAGNCRPVGQPPSHGILAGLIAGAFSGSGGGGSRGQDIDRRDWDDPNRRPSGGGGSGGGGGYSAPPINSFYGTGPSPAPINSFYGNGPAY